MWSDRALEQEILTLLVLQRACHTRHNSLCLSTTTCSTAPAFLLGFPIQRLDKVTGYKCQGLIVWGKGGIEKVVNKDQSGVGRNKFYNDPGIIYDILGSQRQREPLQLTGFTGK